MTASTSASTSMSAGRACASTGLEEAVKRLVAKHCGCDPVPSELRSKVLVRIKQVQAEIEVTE